MAGYVIVNDEISDEAGFAEFRQKVGATVAAHGGRYLVRGGATEVIDGDWAPDRLVVIEFDSVDQAKAWLNSADFLAIKDLRVSSASASVIVAEGVTIGSAVGGRLRIRAQKRAREISRDTGWGCMIYFRRLDRGLGCPSN